MSIKITDRYRAEINAEIENWIHHFPAQVNMDLGYLRSLFFTPEQIEKMEEVEKIAINLWGGHMTWKVPSMQLPAFTPPIKGYSEDTLGHPINASLMLLYPPKRVIPEFGDLPAISRNEYTQHFFDTISELEPKAQVIGLLRKFRDTLDKFTTLEQLRYVFPGTIFILGNRGYQVVANEIAALNRAPKLPDLTAYEVGMFRHLNQWFAGMQLIEAFNSRGGGTHVSHNTVTFEVKPQVVFTVDGERVYFG